MTEREEAAAALAEVNVFFDLSLDMLCIAGLDGYFKRLNPAFSEVLGFSVEELTSRPFNDFVHPDDRNKTAEVVQDLSSGASTLTFENRYRCKDGSYRWLLWHSQPQVDTGLIYATARDVTEQKAAAESVAKLAAIVQSTDDAIVAWSADGHITSWNAGAERMYGYAAVEMIGRDVREALGLLLPDDRPHEIDELLGKLDRGEPVRNVETVRVHKSGRPVDISLTMSLLWDRGMKVGGSLIGREETDRKAAQRERDAHSSMLQAVITNSQSLIYVKDLDGRYLLANGAFEQAFAVRQEDLLGKTDEFLDADLAPVWRLNDLRAQHGAYRLEEWSDAEDGRRHYESVKFPLHDAQGRLYGTCGVSLDVTEMRRSAAALTEARDVALAATAAKSSFLATMSHEIRTPMNAVIGMTGMLLDTSLDHDQRDFVETIRDSGDELLSIINDVLDFSKIEAGRLELETRPFDLWACVDGTIDLLAATAAAKGIGLVCYVDEERQHAVGDVTRVRQVLVNLVSNAVKFTERGEVAVMVTSDLHGDAGARLCFAVTDTGIGIPVDRLPDLFTSFSQVDASTTRKYGGSGLGLAISHRLVTAMGGDLVAESTPAVGSTFSFSLPLRRDTTFTAEPEEVLPNRRGQSALLVSPRPASRQALRMRLEAWGMRCTDAASADDAFALLSGGESFAVAVLDLDDDLAESTRASLELREALASGLGAEIIILAKAGAQPDPEPNTTWIAKPIRRVDLLAALTPRTAAATRSDPDDGSSGGGPQRDRRVLRVLLAEDNVVNQKVAQLMLRKLGHRVDTVSNGREAVNAVRRQPYDVVLMDVQMPEMDGLDATRAIRLEVPPHEQPSIIAMTASVLIEDRTACDAAGMDDYLAKPVRQEKLAAALDGVRRRQRMA